MEYDHGFNPSNHQRRAAPASMAMARHCTGCRQPGQRAGRALRGFECCRGHAASASRAAARSPAGLQHQEDGRSMQLQRAARKHGGHLLGTAGPAACVSTEGSPRAAAGTEVSRRLGRRLGRRTGRFASLHRSLHRISLAGRVAPPGPIYCSPRQRLRRRIDRVSPSAWRGWQAASERDVSCANRHGIACAPDRVATLTSEQQRMHHAHSPSPRPLAIGACRLAV